jgi:hypothetical protein
VDQHAMPDPSVLSFPQHSCKPLKDSCVGHKISPPARCAIYTAMQVQGSVTTTPHTHHREPCAFVDHEEVADQ